MFCLVVSCFFTVRKNLVIFAQHRENFTFFNFLFIPQVKKINLAHTYIGADSLSTYGHRSRQDILDPRRQGKFFPPAHFTFYIFYPCLPTCLPACLPSCLSAFLHTCLPACLPACEPASLHACLHASLHSCLHVCLHVCLHACLHACLRFCRYACLQAYAFMPVLRRFSLPHFLVQPDFSFLPVLPIKHAPAVLSCTSCFRDCLLCYEGRAHPEAKFFVPEQGDIVNSDIGLSHWPASIQYVA
jgi:hypothetical protein